MTYLLGWKSQSNAYIAADSMITSRGGPAPINDRSSFGERQYCEHGDSVAERALKIIVDDDLVIGLCGDFRIARNLASSVLQCYRRLRNPKDALQEMMVSNGPYPAGFDAGLIVAWRGKPFPRLFSFNYDGNVTLKEAEQGEGFQLGSASPMHKGLTWELLKRLVDLERQGPAVHLTAALGVLHSYSIHDYLPSDYVGGSFTGLSITSKVIAWQPDLLYLIDVPGKEIWSGVATCVRDQTLIVNSTMTNDARAFATDVTGTFSLEQWSRRWGSFAQSYITNKRFDFVVLLGLEHRVVGVIEMMGASKSEAISFDAETEPKDGVTWFHLHPGAVASLRQKFSKPEPDHVDFRFWFLPKGGSSERVSE